ncbi:MAG: hypothetical protein KBC06_02650 [Candidatus Pacebacteria bacterium]|nr:hypothetical protein [Candidatus Paceibacterota bacterium]
MKQGPPEKPKEEAPKMLSFEEFTTHYPDGRLRYNNIWLNFETGFVADIYRGMAHYQRFSTEHPELTASLTQKIQNRSKGSMEFLKPIEKDLYEVYKIMRSYGVSDTDIFA